MQSQRGIAGVIASLTNDIRKTEPVADFDNKVNHIQLVQDKSDLLYQRKIAFCHLVVVEIVAVIDGNFEVWLSSLDRVDLSSTPLTISQKASARIVYDILTIRTCDILCLPSFWTSNEIIFNLRR